MLFGTSGIRGKYPQFVNEELAIKIGAVLDGDFLISRDTRRTAVPIFNSVIAGGLISGKEVYVADGEIAPTPTLSYASQYYNLKGIMITASHNPETDCGIKIFEDGKEISRERERKFESKIKGFPSTNMFDYSKVKASNTLNVVEPHMTHILKHFQNRMESKRTGKCKVVIDTNGAASVITPYILEKLGCDVISINSDTFGFNRESEPSPKHLSLLSQLVKSEGANFGIAHDGDADRAVLVDDAGVAISQDIQLLMIVDHILKESKGPIISTVESSLSLEELILSYNQKLFMTPVGSTNISFKLEETDAVFGGEPCGEYVFKDNVHTPDGIFSAAMFVEMFLKYGKFSELKKKYKEYPILRDKFRVLNKSKTMKDISSYLKKNYPGKINEMDGIRLEDKNYWALIRSSGTEDAIRLTIEAKTEELLNRKLMDLSEVIKKFI